tara:strand:- start:275 stop:436 length:162 start_codon:yes stop_codon:yes gene_type:complete
MTVATQITIQIVADQKQHVGPIVGGGSRLNRNKKTEQKTGNESTEAADHERAP